MTIRCILVCFSTLPAAFAGCALAEDEPCDSAASCDPRNFDGTRCGEAETPCSPAGDAGIDGTTGMPRQPFGLEPEGDASRLDGAKEEVEPGERPSDEWRGHGEPGEHSGGPEEADEKDGAASEPDEEATAEGSAIDEDSPSVAACSTFTCSDGKSVPRFYVCDRHPDCSEAEDEARCDFVCDSGEVVFGARVCDLRPDCDDGSDESDCPLPVLCSDGSLIPRRWVCDGAKDCWEGDDETDCPPCD